jgi:HEAT repeat protein
MSEVSQIPFQELIEALIDEETPFNPRFLYRLSDLEEEELSVFIVNWPRLSLWRRKALLEDLEELGSVDDLLSFESIARNVIFDDDPYVRLSAVKILWESEELDLMPLFLEMLESDEDAEVRAAAATGLGQFVYFGELERISEEQLHKLEERLLKVIHQERTPLVIRRTLESLGYSSRKEVAELIERAFQSGDRGMMASALIAMGRSMDTRWEKSILSMLNHKLPELRAESARAAGELESQDAVPTLIELTEDSEENVRLAAIWSLSEIGGDSARHTLEELFREVETDREADFLEIALDNLAFTDGLKPFSLLDFPEEGPEDELLEMLIAQEKGGNYKDNGGDYLDSEEDKFLDNADDDDEDFQD